MRRRRAHNARQLLRSTVGDDAAGDGQRHRPSRAVLDALDPAFGSDAVYAHRVEKIFVGTWWIIIILMRWDEVRSMQLCDEMAAPEAAGAVNGGGVGGVGGVGGPAAN